MAVSFSQPDPSSPAAISSAHFGTSRRGFDPAEVRDFLRMVATELARSQERERFLEREIIAARAPRAIDITALDEETVTSLLGEETARVLTTARESAAQIRAKAEESSTRLVREAQEEAARVRELAELEASRVRDQATRDSETELESARRQGRQMVEESREYREKVVADVARRREAAREHLVQLATGRDRIIGAFDRARLAANDVIAEMNGLRIETDEAAITPPAAIPAPPTTRVERVEPVEPAIAKPPVVVAPTPPTPPLDDTLVLEREERDDDLDVIPETSIAAQPAEPQIADAGPVDDTTVDDLVVDETTVDDVIVDETTVDDVIVDDVIVDDDVAVGDTEEHEFFTDLEADDDPLDAQFTDGLAAPIDEIGEHDTRPLAQVVELFGAIIPTSHHPAERKTADDVFARLRAARPVDVARQLLDSEHPAEPSPSRTPSPESSTASEPSNATTAVASHDDAIDPITQREEALAPATVSLARKLKRVMADEQNDVLDLLRRREPIRSIDAMMPTFAEQVERYTSVAHYDLRSAAVAGSASMSTDPEERRARRINDAGVVEAVAAWLTSDLVEPMRERIGRSIRDADGDNAELANHVRGMYREWKTQRLDDITVDLLAASYASGARAVVMPGTTVRWVQDPHGTKCPDPAEQVIGEAGPQVHQGCRCVVARHDR